MAQSETQKQNKPAAKSSQKRKSRRVSELLIVAFVVVGTLLALTEMGTNIINELNAKAEQAQLSAPAAAASPTPLPTLSPEEYEKLMQNAK